MHGHHRRPVGDFEAMVATPAGSGTGSALARRSGRAERRLVGSSHGRSLARPARPLPTLLDLPSSLSAVAARAWHHVANLGLLYR